MTLGEFLNESGLMPEVEGIAGLLDGRRRDELLGRMPANKVETRLQGALMEELYPLIEQGNVALSFTYPSMAFLVETTMNAKIQFESERALGYLPLDERADVSDEYDARLTLIRNGRTV